MANILKDLSVSERDQVDRIAESFLRNYLKGSEDAAQAELCKLFMLLWNNNPLHPLASMTLLIDATYERMLVRWQIHQIYRPLPIYKELRAMLATSHTMGIYSFTQEQMAYLDPLKELVGH